MRSLVSLYDEIVMEKKNPFDQNLNLNQPGGDGGKGFYFKSDPTGNGNEPGQGSSWDIDGVDGLSRADHEFDREDVDDEMHLYEPIASEQEEIPDFMKPAPVGSKESESSSNPTGGSYQRVFYAGH